MHPKTRDYVLLFLVALFFVAVFTLAALFFVFVFNQTGSLFPTEEPVTDEVEKMNEVVVFETTMGNIEVELYRDKANVTVENFLRYVNESHYEGTVFHRVIDGFMIQGGGFTPAGVQKQVHSPIKLESRNGLSNLNGTIAMARTAVPDSATCQFFINVKNNTFLDYSARDPGYAVFGKVVSGMDVVLRISKVETSGRGQFEDWPNDDVVIRKAYVKK